MSDFTWSSCVLLPGINTLISSAYKVILESLFIPNGKLLMYNKNNKGPKTEPWGTRYFTVS
jgi:hypothetical protein